MRAQEILFSVLVDRAVNVDLEVCGIPLRAERFSCPLWCFRACVVNADCNGFYVRPHLPENAQIFSVDLNVHCSPLFVMCLVNSH